MAGAVMRTATLRQYIRKEFLRYGICADVTSIPAEIKQQEQAGSIQYLTPQRVFGEYQGVSVLDVCVRIGRIYIVRVTPESKFQTGVRTAFHIANRVVPEHRVGAVLNIQYDSITDLVPGILDDLWTHHPNIQYRPSSMAPNGFNAVYMDPNNPTGGHAQWLHVLGNNYSGILDYNAYERMLDTKHRNRVHALNVKHIQQLENVKRHAGIK